MFVTVTVIGLERVSKEDPVAVIEVHYTFVKNVTLHVILNFINHFFTCKGGRRVCSIARYK